MTTRKLAAVPDPARRAIGLIRVSDVGGRGEDLTSPELQRHSIEAYAATRGMRVVEWVEALDESGSRSRSRWWRRLDQAVEKVEAGELDAILVWKFSRAARHRRNWAVALDRVTVAGGVLESATEQLDTTTSTGRLARGMLAELAAWDAEVRGETWKETHARRNRAGLPHNTAKRLGYVVAGKGHEPDPLTGPLLAEAYERYLAGESHRTIHEWLTGLGIVNEITGRAWTVRGIVHTMDSGFAAGLIHHGGYTDPDKRWHDDRWDPGAHTPLITPETWDRYRRARRQRGDSGRQLRRRPPQHGLLGSVRCSGCGHSMRSKKPSAAAVRSMPKLDPGEVYFFACEQPGCPDRHSIKAQSAEEAVLAFLRPLAQDILVSAAAAAAHDAQKVTAQADRKTLERERAKIAERILAAGRSHNSGLYDDATFAGIRDELVAARRRVDEQLDQLASHLERPRPSPELIRGFLNDWPTLDPVGKQQILKSLGITVTVHRLPGKRGRGSGQARCKGGWE